MITHISKIKLLIIFFFVFLLFACAIHLIMKCAFDVSGKLEVLPYVVIFALFLIFCCEIFSKDIKEKFHKEICPSNKAVVYFYYYFSFLDMLTMAILYPRTALINNSKIFYNKKLLINLDMSTYFVFTVLPGDKTFSINNNRHKLHLKFQGGHLYFVKVIPGFFSSKLSIVPEQQALSEISSCNKKVKT